MGLLDFFRKRKKAKARRNRRKRRVPSRAKQGFAKLRSDFKILQDQIGTINIALNKHNDELLEHTKLISENSQGLEKLEQIVTKTQIHPPAEEKTQVNRPVEMTNPPIATKPTTGDSSQKFDINRFSEQEKRILSVFFNNHDMALSYVDIAKALNKSPHTVKNQINQMRLKTDLFNRTVDNDSRNRFRLKDSLKIEKYLNIS